MTGTTTSADTMTLTFDGVEYVLDLADIGTNGYRLGVFPFPLGLNTSWDEVLLSSSGVPYNRINSILGDYLDLFGLREHGAPDFKPFKYNESFKAVSNYGSGARSAVTNDRSEYIICQHGLGWVEGYNPND